MAEFETVDYSKLENRALALSNIIAHALPNGKLYKNTFDELAAFIAPYVSALGASAFTPSSGLVLPTPVGDNNFTIVGGPATYTHSSGNVVATGDVNVLTWNGTAWSLAYGIPIDLKISLQNQAQSLARNLILSQYNTSGKYVESSDGLLYNNAGYTATDFIPVKSNQKYRFEKTSDQNAAWYDKDKNYISGFSNGNKFPVSPSNAQYIRFSIENSLLPTQTFTEYNYNSVTPTVLGDNLLIASDVTVGKYVDSTTGNLLDNASYSTSDYTPVIEGEEYIFSQNQDQYFAYYDTNKNFISGYSAYVANTRYLNNVIIPTNAKYIRFSFLNTETSTTFFKRAYKKNAETNKIEIHVGKSGSYVFTGNNCIKNAISGILDASYLKQYEVVVHEGIYEALVPSDFNQYNNQAFIAGKSFVSIRGVNKDSVIIRGELANNLGASFPYSQYQPLYWHSDYGTVENITITAKNMRYAEHTDDVPLGNKDYKSWFKNCKLIHFGNTGDATNWGSPYPIGLGLSDGQKIEFENVDFISTDVAFSSHTGAEYNKPTKLKLKDCRFSTSNNVNLSARLTSSGSKRNDIIEMVGCSFGAGYKLSCMDYTYLSVGLANASYQHQESSLIGYGNSRFLYLPAFGGGHSLRVKSKNVVYGSVRFKPSSAFDLLIKDPKYTSGVVTNEDGSIDSSYRYRDGSGDINGFAIGRLDLSGAFAIPESSMGRRLGNCSTVNKALIIEIDGSDFTVTFNKNYTDLSNAAILAEINAVISTVATADLYSVANDYFPEFSDVLYKGVASEQITVGDAVVKQNGLLRKSLSTDKFIDGIAIDDILQGFTGRYVKNTYLSVVRSDRFFVKSFAVPSYGDKLSISSTPGTLLVGTSGILDCIDDGIVKV